MPAKRKIDWPNFTITPNVILSAMPLMKESELKVVLAITRVTFGWQEEGRELTLEDIMALSGLSKPSAVTGIKDGMLRGLIDRDHRGGRFYYFLPMEASQGVKNLVSEAKARQLKNLTESQRETVKNLNPPPNNKETVKKRPPPNPAADADKNSDAMARDERAGDARRLFEIWKQKFGHPDAEWTADREAVAVERLAHVAFDDIADLCFDGVLHSDHHMGRNRRSNPKGLVWDRFEWLLKKQERVEMFIDQERARREKGAKPGVEESRGRGRRERRREGPSVRASAKGKL